MRFYNKKKIDQRTPDQIKEHYEIEKELARRLKTASAQERRLLYTSLYNELFRRVKHHPQLRIKQSPQLTQQAVRHKLNLIARFLPKTKTFMEIGPGDCALALKMAELGQSVYAVDVSDEITKEIIQPKNFKLYISDGSSIPVSSNTIDIAYSNQLMEHLHPDDAYRQLRNIYAALNVTGKYICITPNRYCGPSDISKYFDNIATGLHLKEYTLGELSNLFKEVGFSRVMLYAGGRGSYIRFPLQLGRLCEIILSKFPLKIAKTIACCFPLKAILGINIIGVK